MPLPPMAQNERAGTGWSQPPRRSAPAKSRAGCRRVPGTRELDGLGDIMSLLSSAGIGRTCHHMYPRHISGEKTRSKRDHWPTHRNTSNIPNYSSADCCLKNGRVQCSCSFPKHNFHRERPGSYNGNLGKPYISGDCTLPFEKKTSYWHNTSVYNDHFSDDRMPEEFIIDDNELRLLSYYDIPIDVPRRHHVRKIGKVQTVSIIDTLSELASGATDREDEGTFSSAVSESAILNRNPVNSLRSRTRHNRYISTKRGRGLGENSIFSGPISQFSVKDSLSSSNSDLGSSFGVRHESSYDSRLNNFVVDDSNFTCSSLKRTLKYLRKAVSSNVVEEEPRTRCYSRRHEERDAFRLCFSDSEVREIPEVRSPTKYVNHELRHREKSRSMLMVTSPKMEHNKKSTPSFRGRQKADIPDWIQTVFTAAKDGDANKLREGLRDLDIALVRNLSDDHGNNLWHICAAHNNVQCLEWLCSHSQQQVNALGDENKHGFTPVALAVKHGSLLAVQWLIQNTSSKSQLSPACSRSLLHIAAKYGQETVAEWLLAYMQSQDIDVNCLDSEGNTPLHLASKHGHIACVKVLLLHNGNLKVRNERGLKPLNMAIKYSQNNCADYLLAMEACYNLAASSLHLESDVQQLQKENAEMKSYFKELLILTKRLHHRQRELVQTFMRSSDPSQFDVDTSERSKERLSKHLDDYSQLLTAVMADEEHRLVMLEERWKKSRKQPRLIDPRKSPFDVIRSQFTHILDKVADQSPAIPSTPESSDDSVHSGDEDPIPSGQSGLETFSSAPDVLHTLPNHPSTRNRNLKERSPLFMKNREMEAVPENVLCLAGLGKGSSEVRMSTVRTIPGTARDVNLQMFFKQNPNLRQASETCSVLEVLEPSSSDSEECTKLKKGHCRNLNAEKERDLSSSSSALDTVSPSLGGPSSSGSKTSGSRSSSSGSRMDNILLSGNGGAQNITLNSDATFKHRIDSSDLCSSDGVSKDSSRELSHASSCEDSCSVEPDLIRGTQKKKSSSNISLHDPESQSSKEGYSRAEMSLTDNPSISTEDSESLEADKSFCSAMEMPKSLYQGQAPADSTVTGTGVKKKSFLLKFALRGRWPSKHRPRSAKNEISPEEFRETYSRSSSADNTVSPSQNASPGDPPTKKPSNKVKEQDESPMPSTSGNVEKLDEGSAPPPPPPSGGGVLRQTPHRTPHGLLPPRRDPPPAPPLLSRSEDELRPHSDGDDDAISVQKSTKSSCATSSLRPSSLHDPYMSPSASDLWQSPDSKSLFRPASSASRVELPSRVEESFPLNKSSSASTEMLSALDSSTAGRQSPAPSEVSKTESALSPPSDVSKTESTRYLSQLGKIDESSHLSAVKSAAVHHNPPEEVHSNEGQQKSEEQTEIKVKKKCSSSKKEDSHKPWYEFSDEEDVITPQRYQSVTVSMRSSSEEEEIVTS